MASVYREPIAMSDVTPAERERLARILGMLGSEHAGERASAALQAEAFRKKHGLTWAELLALPPVEVVVVMKPDPAMAAQQAQWAAEDAARKARWTAPEPPPPRHVAAKEWIKVSRPAMPIGRTIGIALFWVFLFAQALRPISYYYLGIDF